jgi:hypothetical protein
MYVRTLYDEKHTGCLDTTMHIYSTRTTYRSTWRNHHGGNGLNTEAGFQNAFIRRLILKHHSILTELWYYDNASTDSMLHLGTNDCLRLYHCHRRKVNLYCETAEYTNSIDVHVITMYEIYCTKTPVWCPPKTDVLRKSATFIIFHVITMRC